MKKEGGGEGSAPSSFQGEKRKEGEERQSLVLEKWHCIVKAAAARRKKERKWGAIHDSLQRHSPSKNLVKVERGN